jgi:hypothetical protein
MARTTGAIRHTHRYYLDRTGRGRPTWRCLLDGCTHFLPGNMNATPFGMKSVCFSCDKEFVVTHESLERDKLMCARCSETLDAIDKMIPEEIEKPEYTCLNRACRKPIFTIGFCKECQARNREERERQKTEPPKEKVILVEESTEEKATSEYIPTEEERVETEEKPLRIEPPASKYTKQQQKLRDEQMAAYAELMRKQEKNNGK